MIIEKATEKDIDALEKMYYEVTAQLEKTVNYPAWINGLILHVRLLKRL